MKILRLFCLLGLVPFALLSTDSLAQELQTTHLRAKREQTPKGNFRFEDFPDLNDAMKQVYDSTGVWLKAPRSQTAFKEAYASALSLKLALRAHAAEQKNPEFRSQMTDLVPQVTLLIARFEEYAGTDAASKKLADISLDVAADGAKRESIVQTAIAAIAFASFSESSDADQNRRFGEASRAFIDLRKAWDHYGGLMDIVDWM